MHLDEICRDLTAINETVGEWSAGAAVSDIEKDIVLEKLRNVYSRIKSAGLGEDICPEDPHRDEVPEALPDAPCEAENVPTDAEKKRKALLSLYDQQTVEREEEPSELSERDGKNECSVSEERAAAGVQTICEAYARHSKHRDISSEISSGRIATLSGAIGINDKFQMIRDMFGGDAAAYEDAMRTFESFGDLDDAMVHIYENYNWAPDSPGVTLLVDLLTRKLS